MYSPYAYHSPQPRSVPSAPAPRAVYIAKPENAPIHRHVNHTSGESMEETNARLTKIFHLKKKHGKGWSWTAQADAKVKTHEQVKQTPSASPANQHVFQPIQKPESLPRGSPRSAKGSASQNEDGFTIDFVESDTEADDPVLPVHVTDFDQLDNDSFAFLDDYPANEHTEDVPPPEVIYSVPQKPKAPSVERRSSGSDRRSNRESTHSHSSQQYRQQEPPPTPPPPPPPPPLDGAQQDNYWEKSFDECMDELTRQAPRKETQAVEPAVW